MKKLFFIVGVLWACTANAQFTPGQILTAGELNSQFALYAPLAGATFTGGIRATGITSTPISGSSGSFTNLTASGTVTLPSSSVALASLASQAANTIVANATGLAATPTAIPAPSCSTTSSALNWTSGTGLTCNTTVNAATLGGATFAAPGPIGSTTPSTGAFTTLSATTPVNVASGGTGLGTLTSFNVLIGNGTGNVAFAAPGAAGIPLTSRGAGTNPGFQGITVAGGGTGLVTIPAHGVVIGEGTGNVATATGTTGQMLIGATGADPAFGNTVSTLTATSTITPSSTAGIVGTTTNDNANAGSIGEYQTNSATGTSMTTNVVANCATLSLTAGDWNVWGLAVFVPAASTTFNYILSGISTTSATVGAHGTFQQLIYTTNTFASNNQYFDAPQQRISVASTTTVYLVAQSGFSTSTMTCEGYLYARRVR